MKMFIFDLDGTTIDSSHRHVSDEKGNFCLKSWRANCTRDMIFKDSLLPLADFWKSIVGEITIVISTARVLTVHDRDFLKENGLHADHIFHRGFEENATPDHFLKAQHLRLLQAKYGKVDAIMYDDNEKVRHHLRSLGVQTIHPKHFNER